MVKKKTAIRNAVVVGSGIIAGAALGAAAMAMADKNVRKKTVKTAKRMSSQATQSLAKAKKSIPTYGERSYGAAGGRTIRKNPKKKSSSTQSAKEK